MVEGRRLDLLACAQDMCKASGTAQTTLTPYIDPELLAYNHLSCDGAAITRSGFEYACPVLSASSLREQVDTFTRQGLFPPGAVELS